MLCRHLNKSICICMSCCIFVAIWLSSTSFLPRVELNDCSRLSAIVRTCKLLRELNASSHSYCTCRLDLFLQCTAFFSFVCHCLSAEAKTGLYNWSTANSFCITATVSPLVSGDWPILLLLWPLLELPTTMITLSPRPWTNYLSSAQCQSPWRESTKALSNWNGVVEIAASQRNKDYGGVSPVENQPHENLVSVIDWGKPKQNVLLERGKKEERGYVNQFIDWRIDNISGAHAFIIIEADSGDNDNANDVNISSAYDSKKRL